MKNLITFFIFILFFTFCKKKETTVEEPTPQTTTGGPVTPTSYDGFFQSNAGAAWSGSTCTIGSFYNVNVYLMSSPSPSVSFFLAVNSGTMLLNATKLKYAVVRYYDTTLVLNLSSQKNFQLQSNGSFPSFTYNNVDSFPKFHFNFNNLVNDTLSKSSNYTIPLSGLIYGNEIKCVLFDGSNSLSKTIPIGTAQVAYTPTELAVFPSGSNITLSVEQKKYNIQTIGGKTFRFESNTLSYFPVHVNP